MCAVVEIKQFVQDGLTRDPVLNKITAMLPQKNVMNRIILFLSLFCCLFMSPSRVSAQLFDFVSGYYGYAETTPSIIRRVNLTSALVYYKDNALGLNIIALIDLSLNHKQVALPPDCTVSDMRITGDDIYFCGCNSTGSIIGHIKLSDYSTAGPRTATIYTVDNQFVTRFTRMVAYTLEGKQKVVAIGDLHFTSNPVLTCPGLPPSPPYYPSDCYRTIILEADFNHSSLIDHRYTTTNDENHREFITEVVETENHVAFIGNYIDRNSTVIHRCGKERVVTDFKADPYYLYSTPLEGYSDYHGCVTRGDTIAIASLSSYYDEAGEMQFSTNIRLFDLASMDNTQAQLVPLRDKSEPFELTYMTMMGRLILLQDIYHPTLMSNQNTFVQLEPYYPTDYTAKCWYESYWTKPFYSVCWLSVTEYIASGGTYWCLKDMVPVSSGNCYKALSIDVIVLPLQPKVMDTYTSYQPMVAIYPVNTSPYTYVFTIPDGLFNQRCIEFP
jgi:hypothetical protein